MTVLFYIPGVLVVGSLHRRLVGAAAERFLMPLFDKKDKSRYATFTRRSLGMGGGMARCSRCWPGGSISSRSATATNIWSRPKTTASSERLIAPPRGRILDRFGVELANNRRNYRVLLVAEQATEGVRSGAGHDRQGDPAQPTQQKKRVAARHRR